LKEVFGSGGGSGSVQIIIDPDPGGPKTYAILISVVDPDPRIRDVLKIRIRDEPPGSYFREPRNIFFGLKYLIL
jgi:hypothetical protein